MTHVFSCSPQELSANIDDLLGCFGKYEVELAASALVALGRAAGEWRPCSIAAVCGCPHVMIGIDILVAARLLEWSCDTIVVTGEFVERIRRRQGR